MKFIFETKGTGKLLFFKFYKKLIKEKLNY